jgi:Ca-activated chloride channel family protein
MNKFHFLRPEWLFALPPLLLLLFWLARQRLRSRSWQAVCAPELLPHLLLGRSVRRANWPIWLLLVALLLTIVALAGPAWKRQEMPLFRQQSALVILFDLSRSMQATDLKPNRFQRARFKIADLLRQRKEGQTALIVFAADAFTVTPLTEDRHTIEAMLPSLEPNLMPTQGSDLARAMELGQQLLQQAGQNRGRLLLVTDEDQPELFMDSARQLKEQGFELAVLGVGSNDGAPIPLPEGGFLKDAAGNMVIPRLKSEELQKLATAGGGNYHALSVDDIDLRNLLSGLTERRLDQTDQTAAASGELWREEGVWLLWPLTLLAALAFRRGWLLVLPLILLLPPPAEAFDWQELWRTPDQNAAESFRKEDYPEAAETFEDSRWKASALYRDGKFAESAELLKEPQTADDWYNQGNALAKAGDLASALKAYEQALKLEPDEDDARFNKELVEQALQKQEREQKQQQDLDEQQGQDKQQKDQNEDKNQQQSADDKSGFDGDDKDKSPDQQSAPTAETENKVAEQEPQSQPEVQPPASENAQEQPSKAPEQQTEASPEPGAEQPEQTEEQAAVAPKALDETSESAEQRESRLLLQQIPDDPGGLLRRKFFYQYRQRGQQTQTERSW